MLVWRNGKRRKSFKKSDISKPTHFEHRIHADFDPQTGDIRGLPTQWQAFLSSDFLRRNQAQPIVGDSSYAANLVSMSKNYTVTDFSTNSSSAHASTRNYDGGPMSECSQSTPSNLSTIYSNKIGHFDGTVIPRSASRPTTFDSAPTNLLTDDEEFRNALLSVVDPNDPRADLSKFMKIESGSTSTVFGSYLLSQRRKVAVKCMNIWRQQRRELLFNEALILRQLPRNPNLVECISVHLVGDELWVLMEFMDGGSLTAVITQKRLGEPLIATICVQCLSALTFLHAHGIIHRDIKSDSIMFACDGAAKLSDFGFCGRLTAECPRRRSLLGTPYWFSAQVAAKEPYGTDADVWSFGITVIEMVFGEPPYFDDSPEVAMRKIIELPAATLPPAANASPELESFVARILVKEVTQRATASELLHHPFLYKAVPFSAILPTLHEVKQRQAEKTISEQL